MSQQSTRDPNSPTEANPRLDHLLQTLGREGTAPVSEQGCPPQKALQGFQLGRLSEPEADALSLHLAGCGKCRDVLASLGTPAVTLSSARIQRILQDVNPAASMGWVERLQALLASPGRLAALAGGMAVALLMFTFLSPSESAIPPYQLSLTGALAEVRGEPTATAETSPGLPRLGPNSQLVLTLLPEQGLPGEPPNAAAYLRGEDGQWRLFEPAPSLQVDKGLGMIQLSIEASKLLHSRTGVQRVRVLLLPPGQTPPTPLGDELPTSLQPPQVRVVEQSFDYVP